MKKQRKNWLYQSMGVSQHFPAKPRLILETRPFE